MTTGRSLANYHCRQTRLEEKQFIAPAADMVRENPHTRHACSSYPAPQNVVIFTYSHGLSLTFKASFEIALGIRCLTPPKAHSSCRREAASSPFLWNNSRSKVESHTCFSASSENSQLLPSSLSKKLLHPEDWICKGNWHPGGSTGISFWPSAKVYVQTIHSSWILSSSNFTGTD